MPGHVPAPQHLVRPLIPAAVALIVAACSGATTTSSGAASEAASTAAPASPSRGLATPAPSVAASTGIGGQTGRIEVPEQAFAITLPDGWTRIPLDTASLAQIAGQLPPDSDLAKILSSQAGTFAAAGIKLWAMDLSPEAIAGGFGSNLNVIVQPAPGVTIEVLKAVASGQLGQVDAISNVKSETVNLPVGEAVRTTYDLNQPLGSGTSIEVAGAQYYVLGSGHMYILSFSCAQTEAAACRAKADASMQTFELSGG